MSIEDQKETEVTTTDFLNRRAQILNEVGYGGTPVTVLRRGRKFVRIVPVEDGQETGDHDDASEPSPSSA